MGRGEPSPSRRACGFVKCPGRRSCGWLRSGSEAGTVPRHGRASVPRDGRRGEDRAHPALPRHAAAVAGRLRGAPVPQGRSLGRDVDLSTPVRRGEPRGLPGRRPRHRVVGGRRRRRVHGARAPGPRRDDRVAGRTGVVQRQRGDVRHVVLRLQLAPGGRAPPAGPQGDHPDLRDRPAIHGRRPLRRRSAARHRLPRLPRLHGRLDRASSGPVGLRGGMARRMASGGSRRTIRGSSGGSSIRTKTTTGATAPSSSTTPRSRRRRS